MQHLDALRDQQQVLARNIAATFKTPPSYQGIQTDDVLVKSWSTELRDSNEGSRWVTMKGSHVLLAGNGEILAAHSHLKGKLEGKRAKKFVEEMRAKQTADASAASSGSAATKDAPESKKEAPTTYPKSFKINTPTWEGTHTSYTWQQNLSHEVIVGETDKFYIMDTRKNGKPHQTKLKKENVEFPEGSELPQKEGKKTQPKELVGGKTAQEHYDAHHEAQLGRGIAYQPGMGPTQEERAKKNAAMDAAAKDSIKNLMESDLTGFKTKKSDKISAKYLPAGPIQVRPVKVAAAKPKDEVEALENLVSDGKTGKLSMAGIYRDADSGSMVVTNGNSLVVLPSLKAKVAGSNAVLDPETGDPLTLGQELAGKTVNREDMTFPAYQRAIPTGRTTSGEISDLNEFRARLNGLNVANKHMDTNSWGVRAEISNDGRRHYMDPKLADDVIASLQATGTKRLHVELSDSPNQSIVFRDADNPKKLGLVMPIMRADEEARGGQEFEPAKMPHTNVLSFENGKTVKSK